MRKRHTPAFKAQVVQEALKEVKTIAQLASENDLHPNQISTWKTTAINGLPSLFERENKSLKEQTDFAAEREELYAHIGRLTTQVNWLKKSGLDLS